MSCKESVCGLDKAICGPDQALGHSTAPSYPSACQDWVTGVQHHLFPSPSCQNLVLEEARLPPAPYMRWGPGACYYPHPALYAGIRHQLQCTGSRAPHASRDMAAGEWCHRSPITKFPEPWEAPKAKCHGIVVWIWPNRPQVEHPCFRLSSYKEGWLPSPVSNTLYLCFFMGLKIQELPRITCTPSKFFSTQTSM